MSFEKKIPSDDTLKNGLKDIADAICDAETMVRKEDVNTGTFDPTSNDPAGQKSIAEYSVAKADLDAFTHNFYSNCDIALYMSKELRTGGILNDTGVIYVPYSEKVTSLICFCQDVTAKSNSSEDLVDIVVPDITNPVNCSNMFERARCRKIVFNNITMKDAVYAFMNCKEVTSVSVADGSIAKITGNAFAAFYESSTIVNIGSFDVSEATNLDVALGRCHSLKSLHFKHIRIDLDISNSTQFEEADLVEIIGNLVDLTGKTPHTLTMGETNLAKLTDAEKAVAVNKNWVLA